MTTQIHGRFVMQAALLSLLLFAGGCASSASTVDRSAPYGAPKGVVSARVVHSAKSQSPSKGDEVVNTARSLIGIPYKWGGRSPETGFDCSGFVGYVYSQFGIDMPRTSSDILSKGHSVRTKTLMPGDVVVYNISKKGKSLHVGIATGDGTFVHAPSSGKGVSESSLSNPYWREHFLEARRIF